jgi:hypothetical protein
VMVGPGSDLSGFIGSPSRPVLRRATRIERQEKNTGRM